MKLLSKKVILKILGGVDKRKNVRPGNQQKFKTVNPNNIIGGVNKKDIVRPGDQGKE